MSKYKAKKTEVDGRVFDSLREAARYSELVLLQQAGEISNLECQRKFSCDVNNKHICNYFADFYYQDNSTGLTIIEDVKGMRTPVYRLKKKLVCALLDIDIIEV